MINKDQLQAHADDMARQDWWPLIEAELASLCEWEGCTRPAVAAIRFHNQAGHTHDCGPHLAQLREWCDIAEAVPLPCPWPHGAKWSDQPRDLETHNESCGALQHDPDGIGAPHVCALPKGHPGGHVP